MTIKKIIAREFLYAALTAILFFFIAYSSHLLVEKWNEQYENIKTEQSKIKDILYTKIENQSSLKLLELSYSKKDWRMKFPEFVLKTQSDSSFAKEIFNKLKTNANFEEYLSDIKIDNETKNQFLITISNKKKYTDKRKNDVHRTLERMKLEELLLVLIIVIFGIRYFIYALKWSVETLRK